MKPLQAFFIVFIVIAGFYSSLFAKTWYIKPDGTGEAPTIKAGIDSAAVADTVLLADGTYSGIGNRGIGVGKAITLRSESGNPDACIIDCEGVGWGFFINYEEGPESVLEGMTIANAYFAAGAGGAVHSSFCSLTFNHCNFIANVAGGGGAVACAYTSLTFNHCKFFNNSSTGPVYEDGGGGVILFYSSATFTYCVFSGNSANRYGGGIFCRDNSSATLTNCTFSHNSALHRGAGVACLYS